MEPDETDFVISDDSVYIKQAELFGLRLFHDHEKVIKMTWNATSSVSIMFPDSE